MTLLKDSGSSYSGGKGNLLPCSRFTPRVRTRRPLRPEVVLNGPIDRKSTKADADETLKENQAAEEAALQAQITKAQAAGEALGDVQAFAKQAADLRSEITHLEKKAAGGKAVGKSSLAHRVE